MAAEPAGELSPVIMLNGDSPVTVKDCEQLITRARASGSRCVTFDRITEPAHPALVRLVQFALDQGMAVDICRESAGLTRRPGTACGQPGT